ncbi:MAG: DUF1015 domain-containing protein [Proteobacteria bacterium]|nr:DUF1015 domain-containing protein [Pseudomonadota bacterium]MBU1742931.1 DUF1015 domain-containing protein [Pseudomonadota bacterium]
MAEIRPFRGVHYNPPAISLMRAVTAPPYDVIPPEQQEELHRVDPHNVIRLILGQTLAGDDERNNRYTRAAAYFRTWQQERVLIRDERPAVYYTETDFRVHGGQTITRRGMIVLVKAQDYEDGVILPHESTFSGTKKQRLELIKQVRANFSCIFSVYPDHELEIIGTLQQTAHLGEPIHDFDDLDGCGQRIWAVRESAVIRRVAELMSPKNVFIADGHHRYETAQNYRRQMSDLYPQAGPGAAFNYTMMFLCATGCPGLVILPAHRMLPTLEGFDPEDFISRAGEIFHVERFSYTAHSSTTTRLAFKAAMKKNGNRASTIGLVAAGEKTFYTLTLKDGVMARVVNSSVPEPMWELDSVVLTRVILMHLLGLTAEDLDKEETISYWSNTDKVMDTVVRGKARLAFLLNPARIEQVERIARAGLILPRKTTYFYPKILTGLVMNPIDPGEEIKLP